MRLSPATVLAAGLTAALAITGCGPNPYDGVYSGLFTYTYFTESGGQLVAHPGNTFTLTFTMDCTHGPPNTSTSEDGIICDITEALCTDPIFGAQMSTQVDRSWALLPKEPPATNYKGSINIEFPNSSTIVSFGPINVSQLRTLEGPPPSPNDPRTWLATGPSSTNMFPKEGQDQYGQIVKPIQTPSWAVNKQ